MAANKRRILIEVLGDASGFAKASGVAGGATTKLQKLTDTLGKSLLKAYAVKRIIQFGLAAVRAAADDAAAQKLLATAMKNTTGATDEQVASMEDWITKISYATGYLDDDLRPAMATLLRSTKDQAKAQELMQLAMDVSRGTGKDLGTVTAALAKAYGGNTVSLAKLVPGIKLAGEGTLTFANAQARLNQQFAGSASDYANTAAGKLARLNAQYQDMRETIGTALMPILSSFVGILAAMFGWFNSLSEPVQNLIVAITVGATAAYVASIAIGGLNAAMAALGITAQVSQPWLMGISLAIGAVVAAAALFSDETDSTSAAQEKFNNTVRSAAQAVDLQTLALLSAASAGDRYRESVLEGAKEDFRQSIRDTDDLGAMMDKLGISMEEAVDASMDRTKAMQLEATINQRLDDLKAKGINTTREERRTIGKLIDLLDVQNGAYEKSVEQALDLAKTGDVVSISYLKELGLLGELTPAEQRAAEAALDAAAAKEKEAEASTVAATAISEHQAAADRLTSATERTRDKLSEAAQAADDLKAAIDAVFSPFMDFEEAQRGLVEASDRTTASLNENGATLNLYTEKGRANREAVQQQAKAILDLGVAMVGQGATNEEAAASVDAMTANLRSQLEMLGLSTEEVDAYLASLGLTPSNVKTTISLAQADKTKRELTDMLGQLEDVDAGAKAEITADIASGNFETARAKIDDLARERNVKLRVSVNGGGTISVIPHGGMFTVAAYAKGTRSAAAGLAVVGENGPELLSLAGGEQILPAGPTAELLSGRRAGGGGTTTVRRSDLHFHIAGSVVTERQLQDVVAAGVRQANRREGRDTLVPRRAL